MNGLLKLIVIAASAAAILCPIPVLAQVDPGTDTDVDADTDADADTPSTTSNEMSYGDDSIDKQNMGIVGAAGGAIVGGELVVAVEALIGIDKLWPYLTFPFLGAAGGGVGGYFLGQASPEGAVAMLVSGIILVIPTAIAASAAMAYDPEEEGAMESDMSGEAKFSFEQTPTETGAEQGQATTEVESRPEGPPTPGAAEPAAPEPVPEAIPEDEAPPQTGEPGTGATSSNRGSRRTTRAGRAPAGSLLHVASSGDAAVSMPLVEVRPAIVSSKDTPFEVKSGVEIFVPLVRIDLP